MQSPDYKFWAGIGVALVSLAPEIPDWLRIALVVVGGALILVSATGGAIRGLLGRRPASRPPGPHAAAVASGPAYWTLTEAITWLAFGEAVSTSAWQSLMDSRNIGYAEQRQQFLAAERALFDALSDPSSGIDVQGKQKGDNVHRAIPHSVFLSNIGASVLDDSIGMPLGPPLETILNWNGPEWQEVRVRRSDVQRKWSMGSAAGMSADHHVGALRSAGEARPASGATVMRTAFDETQSINVLPSSLGGKHLLRLGNLATLRLGVPYSLEMVTLRLDATPMRVPDHKDEKITVEDITITKGRATEYTFDTTKNKRHEIAVAGRAYIVTLLESKKLNTPNVRNPIEWVFGITEK